MKKTTAVLMLTFAMGAQAGTISTYTNRAAFDASVKETTVETFLDHAVFPIPGGVLNSKSSFTAYYGGQVHPGDIKAGVTYSTPVSGGNYFNIDGGGNFAGGFLDNVGSSDLTITFDSAVKGFGFDTNSLMPNFDLSITFADGQSWTQNVHGINTMSFFGYESGKSDIKSVVLNGYGAGFGFAIDNFTFGGVDAPAEVPEPSVLALLGLGMAGIGFARRRKQAA